MAAPEKKLPGRADHGRLRASHSDRDGVITSLKSAYVLGFVTKDEFDARVSQTLSARTYAELAVVTTDLPAWLVAAQPQPRRLPARSAAAARAASRPVDRAIVGCALLAAVAFVAAIISRDGWVALGAVGSALTSLALIAGQLAADRRPRQPGGRLPGGRLPGPGRIDSGSSAAAPSLAPESPRAIQRGRAGGARPQSRRRPLLSC
jgi:uncharacterized protein DUF1707